MKTWVGLLWLIVLIPLSVDNYWSIPFKAYDIRIPYLGAALACLTLLASVFSSSRLRGIIQSHFRSPSALAFGGMGLAGGLGIYLNSTYPERGAYFWVWSMGTLVGVPLLARFFAAELGHFVPRSIAVYFSVQSLLVISDGVACNLTRGAFHLGRVLLHSDGVSLLCRPHAWYQEPGYFAAFGLVAAVFLKGCISFEKQARWARFHRFAYVLGIVALYCSTSRLGWIGATFLLGWDLKRYLRLKPRVFISRALWVGCAALLMMASGLALIQSGNPKPLVSPLGTALLSPATDKSFSHRLWRTEVAWKVFTSHPWIGVGPGTAGAFAVDHRLDQKTLSWFSQEAMPMLRRDPLSQNLYTELLSEWGLLGTLFFLAGLFYYTRSLSSPVRIQAWSALALVYVSTQTLPRFDLWLVLGSLCSLPELYGLSAIWEIRRARPGLRTALTGSGELAQEPQFLTD